MPVRKCKWLQLLSPAGPSSGVGRSSKEASAIVVQCMQAHMQSDRIVPSMVQLAPQATILRSNAPHLPSGLRTTPLHHGDLEGERPGVLKSVQLPGRLWGRAICPGGRSVTNIELLRAVPGSSGGPPSPHVVPQLKATPRGLTKAQQSELEMARRRAQKVISCRPPPPGHEGALLHIEVKDMSAFLAASQCSAPCRQPRERQPMRQSRGGQSESLTMTTTMMSRQKTPRICKTKRSRQNWQTSRMRRRPSG